MTSFVFRVIETGEAITLPVTPSGFEISHGQRIESMRVHEVGDVVFPGYGTLATIKVDCLFPAQRYSFSNGHINPYELVEKFSQVIDKGYLMRFVVTDSPMNLPVLLERITYGERDGTGDVYATLQLREYREIKPIQVDAQAGVGTPVDNDEKEKPPAPPRTHTVVRGDTLSGLCKKYYGRANLYPALARVNSIKNPHLIRIGQVIQLPEKSTLEAMT